MAVATTSLNPPAVRRLLQIVLLLLLALAGVGLRYVYHRGLTKSWREWMVEEVRKHGVEVSFARLTVRPFRGLVAKDVIIFDSPDRNRVLARVNEMVVEANYANAAAGKPFLDALTLVDTSLRVPLDPKQPGGPSVDVQKLNARILFPPNQVHVIHLDAEVLGIHLRAGGKLVIAPGAPIFREEGAANPALLLAVVNAMRQVSYVGGAPRLTVQFSGDTSRPREIVVDADLTAHGVRLGSYSLTSLAASANWQNGMLLLSRLEATDPLGRFDGSGSFDPKSRTANLQARSGLDLARIARGLKLWDLRAVSLEAPPEIDVTARVQLPDGRTGRGPGLKLLGQARLGRLKLGGNEFDGLSASFSWDGARWAVRDAVLRHPAGGELKADAQQDYDDSGKGDFRIGVTSTLNPELLAPLLGEKESRRLALFKFHDAPVLTLSGRGSSPGLDTLSAAGQVQFGRISYRGVEARRGDARFRYQGRAITVDSFDVARAEGSASGGLVFDFGNDTVEALQVRSTLHPADAARWVDPDILPEVTPYRFGKQPPSVLIDGLYDCRKGGTRTRLNVTVDAPNGLDYTFIGKELRFGPAKGKLFFTDERLKLSDTRAELFGGTVTGDGSISLLRANPGHTASVRISGVNFASLSKLYFDYEGSEGRIDGSYNFTGRGDDGRSMRGEGEVRVTDGNVFAIPFLGPFSEILNRIVPGLGFSKAQRAAASFGIADGVITTKDFTVTGKGFSMIGDGRIWFADDRMDFDVRINAQGLPGVLLFPVSKLFEYRAQSKFSKPEWRPKMMPRLGGERPQ